MVLSYSASVRRFSVTRNDCFLKTIGVHARESFQCQFCSSRTHVLATVLARTCNRPRTYLREKMIIALFFLLTPGIYIPKQAGKKKDCVAIGTQSDMYV